MKLLKASEGKESYDSGGNIRNGSARVLNRLSPSLIISDSGWTEWGHQSG